jgi:hypothetical protein
LEKLNAVKYEQAEAEVKADAPESHGLPAKIPTAKSRRVSESLQTVESK